MPERETIEDSLLLGTKPKSSAYEEIRAPVPTPYGGQLAEGKEGVVKQGSLIIVKDKETEQTVLRRVPVLRNRKRTSIEELSLSQADVIERAKELEEKDALNSAVSLLITTFDELFRRGQFPLCDSILHRADPEQCSTGMLVWIIKATWPARSKLALRAEFVECAKQVIQQRGNLRADAIDRLE